MLNHSPDRGFGSISLHTSVVIDRQICTLLHAVLVISIMLVYYETYLIKMLTLYSDTYASW